MANRRGWAALKIGAARARECTADETVHDLVKGFFRSHPLEPAGALTAEAR